MSAPRSRSPLPTAEAAVSAATSAATAAATAAASAALHHLPGLVSVGSSVRSSLRSSLTSTLDLLQHEAPASLTSSLHLDSLNKHVKQGTLTRSALSHVEDLAHRASDALNDLTHPDNPLAATHPSHKRRHTEQTHSATVDDHHPTHPHRVVADSDSRGEAAERRRKGQKRWATSESSLKPASRPISPDSARSPSRSTPVSPALSASGPASAPASPRGSGGPAPAAPPPPVDVSVWPTLSPAELLEDMLELLKEEGRVGGEGGVMAPLWVPRLSLLTLPLQSPYKEVVELHAGYLEVARAIEGQEKEYVAIYAAMQQDRSDAEREMRAMMGDVAQVGEGADEKEVDQHAMDTGEHSAQRLAPSVSG